MKPDLLPHWHIYLDDKPYQGEAEGVERSSYPGVGRYYSAVTRNPIKVGHPLDLPIDIISHINLRSHIERITRRMAEGYPVKQIRIERVA